MTYEGTTWTFINGQSLGGDLGRNTITPQLNPDSQWSKIRAPSKLIYRGDQETSIEATITAFRWVLVSSEGKPLEAAYLDPWLHDIGDESEESVQTPLGDSGSLHGSLSGGLKTTHRSEQVQSWVDQQNLAGLEISQAPPMQRVEDGNKVMASETLLEPVQKLVLEG